MIMDNPFKEQRQHPRIYRNFMLSYYEKGRSSLKNDISQIHNISQGGMSFVSTHSLDPQTIVEIDLTTPFIANSLHLEGVVLESKEKISDLIYEIRVQFKDVPEHELAVLAKIESYGKTEEI
jgi:hypothetical protein